MGFLSDWSKRHGKSLHFSPLGRYDISVDDVLERGRDGSTFHVTAIGLKVLLAEQLWIGRGGYGMERGEEQPLVLEGDEWLRLTEADIAKADWEGENDHWDSMCWVGTNWKGTFNGEKHVSASWFKHDHGLGPHNEYRAEEHARRWKAALRRYYKFDFQSEDDDSWGFDTSEDFKSAGVWQDSLLTVEDCTFAEAVRYFTRPLPAAGNSLPVGMVGAGATLMSVWAEEEEEGDY